MIGHIPKKIAYIINEAKTSKIQRRLDDTEEDFAEELLVYPTFPTDAENTKTIESGKSWAEVPHQIQIPYFLNDQEILTIKQDRYNRDVFNYNGRDDGVFNYRYNWTQPEFKDKVGQKYINITVPDPNFKEPIVIIEDNGPIDDIKIVGLEHRGNGGRAYKVIVDGKYYFDLREDVLLELMITVGIKKGGILNGQYCWARIGSQMKIIRMGSMLHYKMLDASELHNKKKLTTADLEIGCCYRTKTQTLIYLGNFDTIDINQERNKNGYGARDYSYKPVIKKNHQLWLDVGGWAIKEWRDKNDYSKEQFDGLLNQDHWYYSFLFKKSLPPIILKEKEKLELPIDFIEKIRNASKLKMKKALLEDNNKSDILYTMSSYAETIHIVKKGDTLELSEEFKSVLKSKS